MKSYFISQDGLAKITPNVGVSKAFVVCIYMYICMEKHKCLKPDGFHLMKTLGQLHNTTRGIDSVF